MKLFETYNISIKKVQKKDGTMANFAYIDPEKSTDSTMDIKDDLKNYGARWNGVSKVWGWFLSPDSAKLKTQLETIVYPAIEFLNSKETPGENGPRTADDMKSEFNETLKAIDDAINGTYEVPANVPTTAMSERELKDQLKAFKEELVTAMSSDDFLEKLEPIIKFRNANGHELSFANALLIWIQDKQAKLVKARGTWAKLYHRTVKPGAPALYISVPNNERGSRVIYATKEEKEACKREFLQQVGKNSVDELTAGQKDILRVRLLQLNKPMFTSFKYVATYYDVRFTEQMEGYEDEVGSLDGAENLEWSDRDSEPTELTTSMYDAMLSLIQEEGIVVNQVDDLGNALAQSKSGQIDILRNTPKNAGGVSTLIHEFAHEVLHQRFLKNRDQAWANYFVGTQHGRQDVEQQAELTAYLVLRFFGIKLQQNLTYTAIWGADADKAARVFDQVANLANNIRSKLAAKLGMKRESLSEEEMPSVDERDITGYDVAELLGGNAVAVYNRSRRKMASMVKEDFYRIFDKINKQLF